jgi:UDP-N-acetylglucosamine--N-acetylmuramyl-(pentapeptide) pyrophosphoryl-undecaprenol N-acetylglucosamine transferase
VHVIDSSSLSGNVIKKIFGMIKLGYGYLQSKKLIKKYKPSVVVGFGGYPSLPPIIAAIHKNIRTVIHEANAVLGRTNSFVAGKVTKIALSHPDITHQLDNYKDKITITGNPVRADIANLYTSSFEAPERDAPFHITIMGGSLGAKVMAQNIPKALSLLSAEQKARLRITQQCHQEDISFVKKIYDDANISFDLLPFIKNVPDVLKRTHLIIARSGASTVSEIAVAGIPAIFIPYPYHADQQQKINAQVIESIGGAWIVEEKNITPKSISELVKIAMDSQERLFKMAEATRSCAKPDASRKLGNCVSALIKD